MGKRGAGRSRRPATIRAKPRKTKPVPRAIHVTTSMPVRGSSAPAAATVGVGGDVGPRSRRTASTTVIVTVSVADTLDPVGSVPFTVATLVSAPADAPATIEHE